MSATGGGRGGTGGRSGGRGLRSGRTGGGNRSQYPSSTDLVVKGREDKLSGHIFDCGDPKHAEKYGTTLEEVYQFIRTSFTDGENIVRAMKAGRELRLPNRLLRPARQRPTEDMPQEEVDLLYEGDEYKLKLQSYVKRSDLYQANLCKAYGVVLGQCTTRLRRALEASNQWRAIEEEADVFRLMVAIRKEVRSTDTTDHYNADTLAKAVSDFYELIQHYNQSDDAYYCEFKARCDIVHQNGAWCTPSPHQTPHRASS